MPPPILVKILLYINDLVALVYQVVKNNLILFLSLLLIMIIVTLSINFRRLIWMTLATLTVIMTFWGIPEGFSHLGVDRRLSIFLIVVGVVATVAFYNRAKYLDRVD